MDRRIFLKSRLKDRLAFKVVTPKADFVTMTLEGDKAAAILHQNEFFFPKPLAPGEKAPAEYAMIMEENKGAFCSFPLKNE